jgi:hypothetical protein
MTEDELDQFNYAVGVLVGLGHKYGVVDVTIYHGLISIRITRNPPVKERDDDDGTAR